MRSGSDAYGVGLYEMPNIYFDALRKIGDAKDHDAVGRTGRDTVAGRVKFDPATYVALQDTVYPPHHHICLYFCRGRSQPGLFSGAGWLVRLCPCRVCCSWHLTLCDLCENLGGQSLTNADSGRGDIGCGGRRSHVTGPQVGRDVCDPDHPCAVTLDLSGHRVVTLPAQHRAWSPCRV